MRDRLIISCWLILLAIFLSGCGFQLRGENTVPKLSTDYAVQVKSPYPNLNHQFERELHRMGFKVVNSDPQFVIEVRNQVYDNLEFNLSKTFSEVFKRINYHFNYAVYDSEGAPVIGPQTSVLSSDYFNPSGNHLQMLVAEENALNRLRRQAAVMIANQLIAEMANPATNSE